MPSVKGARSSTARRDKSVRIPSRPYKLYAVNFHGSGLQAIRNQFIEQIKDGLRRHVFVIDLEEEKRKAIQQTIRDDSMSSGGRLTGKKRPTARASLSERTGTSGLLGITLNAIRDRQQQYMEIVAALEKEQNFDLVSYLMRESNDTNVRKRKSEKSIRARTSRDSDKENAKEKGKNRNKDDEDDRRKSKLGRIKDDDDDKKERRKSKGGGGDTAKPKSRKSKVKESESIETSYSDIVCPDVITSKHNIVGNPKSIMNRKYIEDDPPPELLYIIIIGELNNDFYMDLLDADQPLAAVVNFLPEEGAWDRLVPRVRQTQSKFIKDTMLEIQKFICTFRQSDLSKPVGVFQTQLPIISVCMALKYCQEIFSELTWYMYDVEMLLQQYYMYYVEAFRVTDVSLPSGVSLRELMERAFILNMNGHYLQHVQFGADTSDITMAMYIDMLFNTVEEPADLLQDCDIKVFASACNDNAPEHAKTYEEMVEKHRRGFQSITKVERYDRIFVEEANTLLTSLMMHSNSLAFRSVFRLVLEYDLVRQLHMSGCLTDSTPYKKLDEDSEIFMLPPYAKFYATEDSVQQRLNKLLTDYDDYEVEEIRPGHKLYCFRRTFNEIFEFEKRMVLPTRLCFRDFTVYQLEDFLQQLMTPELRVAIKDAGRSPEQRRRQMLRNQLKEVESGVFLRPDALKTQMPGSEGEMRFFGQCAAIPDEGAIEEDDEPEALISEQDSSAQNSDYIGLPPKSPLLHGYNLDDVRQVIRVKEAKYYYEEGYMKLYEECCNFTETNRALEWEINSNKINLVGQRGDAHMISPSIRITTSNEISLRILNLPDECAKMVINYPNGLSIYYLKNFIEQTWSHEEDTFENESKRLNTPYGAVIVYYVDAKMIVVLRYNGEVYRLYQYVPEEEEEMLDELNDNSEGQDTSSQSVGGKTTTSVKTSRSRRRKSMGSDLGITEESSFAAQLSAAEKTPQELLRDSVAFEMNYLQFLAKIYKLSWMHVSITTSEGRVVDINGNGAARLVKRLELTEWFDYDCDESLAERSDAVRMIWKMGTLKCYHADGTVIMTRFKECLEDVHVDEFDSRISTSSSHENLISSEESGDVTVEQPPKKKPCDPRTGHRQGSTLPKFIFEEEFIGVEMEAEPDRRYVKVTCTNFIQHHTNYASVYLICDDYYAEELDLFMEVWAYDGIRLNARECLSIVDTLCEEGEEANDEQSFDNVEDMLSYTKPGARDDANSERRTYLTIWIGDFFYLYVTEQKAELCALMHRYNEEFERKRDCIQLCFPFDRSLHDIFHEFTEKISKFKNYAGSKSKVFFFLEKFVPDCQKQGFEFVDEIPPLGQYNFQASNTFTEFTPIKTLNESYENCFNWFCHDMMKFPRFPKITTEYEKSHPPYTAADLFPWVLKSNFYVQIPRLLRTTDRIHVFLQPMENVNFKKLQRHMNEALIYHIRPQIRIELRRYISYISWKIRKDQHIRRLLVEQQRKGLYHAMLRYKEYPRYWNFVEDFNGRVQDIDFFEFMLERCNENNVEKKSKFPPDFPSDDRKTCFCPKYEEALKPPKKRGCCAAPICTPAPETTETVPKKKKCRTAR